MTDSSLLTRSVLLLTIALMGAGCTRADWRQLRGEGFTENAVHFDDNPRPREGAGSAGTLSAKAREIERNFGFE